MIRKELGKSDLEQPVFRAIASAWSAGANDQAIMEFLAAVSGIRIPAVENVARSVEVMIEAGRLCLAEVHAVSSLEHKGKGSLLSG